MSKSQCPWLASVEDVRSGRTPPITQYVMDTGVPGTFGIAVTTKDYPFPLGVLYIRSTAGKAYEILDIQVRSTMRQCGLGKALIERFVVLCEANKYRGFTEAVTDLSKGLLARAGFVKKSDGYWLPYPQKKARKK